MLVRPKPGILDPQGQAVESSLRHLGFAVGEARIGKVVDVKKLASRRAAAPNFDFSRSGQLRSVRLRDERWNDVG